MIRHHVLTLDGTVQRLDSVVGARPGGIRTISLQPNGGNTGPVYVGSTSSVSNSDYGVRLEAAVSTIPPAPFVLGEFPTGWAGLAEVYVKGTNGEKLHLLIDYAV